MDGQGNPRSPRKPFADARTEAIIGCAIEVQRELGAGYLERVYQLALGMELQARRIPHALEVEMPVWYKGHRIPVGYRADVVCHGDILVELKASAGLGPADLAQVIHYLKSGRIPVGLLLNFGTAPMQVRRMVGPLHFQPHLHDEEAGPPASPT